MTKCPKKVNSHLIFKNAKKIRSFFLFCLETLQRKINKQKKCQNSLQLLGQEKKCLVMISWHSMDDPMDHIFEFPATRALKWYKYLIWG